MVSQEWNHLHFQSSIHDQTSLTGKQHSLCIIQKE